MAEQNTYLVVLDGEFVDGCAWLTDPEGEFGGEHYAEGDPQPLVFAHIQAINEGDAIRQVAEREGMSGEMFTAYQLANPERDQRTAMQQYVDNEVEYLLDVMLEEDEITEEKHQEYTGNLQEIANDVLDDAGRDFDELDEALREHIRNYID